MTQSKFISELEKLNITVDLDILNKLEKYYELLVEWNEKINLTSIIEKDKVYLKHFYDSLTLTKIIDFNDYSTFCDIGTGAGFPGMVIKIFYPHLKVTLIDSLNKRTIFLNKVISELELNNIEIIHARAEEYGKINREKYDIVTARAVTNINNLLEFCIPLTKVNGIFVAMKTNMEELNNIKKSLKELNTTILNHIEFLLPIENSKRVLISFLKKSQTNKKYPRKFSEIKKNPI